MLHAVSWMRVLMTLSGMQMKHTQLVELGLGSFQTNSANRHFLGVCLNLSLNN